MVDRIIQHPVSTVVELVVDFFGKGELFFGRAVVERNPAFGLMPSADYHFGEFGVEAVGFAEGT